jgi:4-carboxymuconolactone decarboxylase
MSMTHAAPAPIPGAQAVNRSAADDRYERGAAKLREVDGDRGLAVIDALADVAPDLGRYVVEFAYGDTYSRPDLEPRQRQLVTIGILAALGGAEPQLTVHVNAALNVGLTPTEIIGAIIHAVPYVGFPRALNALFTAKAVFAERDLLPVRSVERVAG